MGDETPPLDPVGNNGHAPDGRFAPRNGLGHRFGPGNRYGKGNPVTRRIHELRREAVAAETPQRTRAVLEKLHELALGGDVAAAKLYLETVIGKAPQAVELTGADGERLGGGDAEALADVLTAALAPFPEDVRYAVLGAIWRANRRGDDDRPG